MWTRYSDRDTDHAHQKGNAMRSPPLVSLAPSNLATPPHLWSAPEVKAWLEYCDTEFALSPVCVDKFDMNGKALCLLKREDFMERAPHAGDVLFNAFQHLRQNDSQEFSFLPTSTPPVFLSSPTDVPLGSTPSQSARQPFYPLLPKPTHISLSNNSETISRNYSNNHNDNNNRINSCHTEHTNHSTTTSNRRTLLVATEGESPPLVPAVPPSMLSPAPSEKCASDTDLCNNDNGNSPPSGKHDVEMENMNSDLRDELQCEGANPQEDGVCRLLWEFIYQLLQDDKFSELVCWESQPDLTFRINNPTNLAELWGMQKNRNNMTYEKLSRALRYYYKMNIIQKVIGKRLTYRFLQHPTKIRKGQRGARPHASRLLPNALTEDGVTETGAASVTDSHMPPTSCHQTDIMNEFDHTDSPRPLMISEGRTEEQEHSSPRKCITSFREPYDMAKIKSSDEETHTWTSRDISKFPKTERDDLSSMKCNSTDIRDRNSVEDPGAHGNSNHGSCESDDGYSENHVDTFYPHQRFPCFNLHPSSPPPSSPHGAKDNLSPPLPDYLRRSSSSSPSSSFVDFPAPPSARCLTPSEMKSSGFHKLVHPYPLPSSWHHLHPETQILSNGCRSPRHSTFHRRHYNSSLSLNSKAASCLQPEAQIRSTEHQSPHHSFHQTMAYDPSLNKIASPRWNFPHSLHYNPNLSPNEPRHTSASHLSHFYNKQMKVEKYEEEQEGPEDLSMKTSSNEPKLIKPECTVDHSMNGRSRESECPPDSDSPKSASPDSSYSSDKADYGRDGAAERSLLPTKDKQDYNSVKTC